MNKDLKSINIFSLLVQGTIGIRLLTVPRDVIEHAGNDAWISMIIMYFLSLITAFAFYWIAIQYQGMNLAQINVAVFGKFFGRLIISSISIYVLLNLGLFLRLFSYSIRIFLLDKTPDIVIMTSILLLCVYCLSKDIKTLSIVMDIFLPLVLISCVLLVLLPIKSMDFREALPVMHNGIVPILIGASKIVDPILPVALIAFVMPYFTETKKIKGYIFSAITIVSLIYLSIIHVCLLVFGKDEIHYLLFPTITLIKAIKAKSIIIERAESFFMITWIPITFSSILLNLLIMKLLLKELFNTSKEKVLIYSQTLICLVIAYIPPNIVTVLSLIEFNGKVALIMNFILLPTTIVFILIKKRRMGKNEN